MFHSQTLGLACPATHNQEHVTAITARRHTIRVPQEKGSHAGVVPAETHVQIHQPSLCVSPRIAGAVQQLFLDSVLVLSVSPQSETVLCDLFLEVHEQKRHQRQNDEAILPYSTLGN